MKKKLLLILIVLLAILAGIYLVKTNQEVREKAESRGGELKFSSEKDGQIYRVDVLFRSTSTVPVDISTISLKLVSSEAATKSVEVVDEKGLRSSVISIDEQLSSNGWTFPVNKVIREDGKVEINLVAALNKTEGFSTANFTKLASFYLSGRDGVVSFTVDREATAIYTKGKPVRNLLTSQQLENFIVVLEEDSN